MNPSDLLDAESPSTSFDYVSKLPAELFGRIYKLAYAKTKPIEPLSRALRPFYDELIFRKVKATPDERAKQFQQMLKVRPAIGLHVRDLRWEEDANPSDAACEELVDSFSCMPTLHTLSFRAPHSRYLDLFFPVEKTAESVLPMSLVSLTLLLSSDTRCDAYDPHKLPALGALPHLTKLNLDFRHKYQSPQNVRSEPSELVLSRIATLSLGLPKNPSSVNALLSGFSHVRKLTLTSQKSSPDFASAFASVKSPTEVVELTLRASPEAGWRFPDELATFKSLEAFNLVGKFEDLTLDASEVFGRVPNKTLTLGKKSSISGEVLYSLVDKLMPSLKTLRLDHMAAESPTPDDYAEGDPETILQAFEIPEFPASFGLSALVRLSKDFKNRGLKTQGKARRSRSWTSWSNRPIFTFGWKRSDGAVIRRKTSDWLGSDLARDAWRKSALSTRRGLDAVRLGRDRVVDPACCGPSSR